MTTLPYTPETPSQTAGPYVHIGLIPHQAGFDIFQNNFGNVLVGPDTQGERIRIEGRVLDGTGSPVRDALVEIDGRSSGFTPAVLPVPVGPHRVRVSLSGFRPVERDVEDWADRSLLKKYVENVARLTSSLL